MKPNEANLRNANRVGLKSIFRTRQVIDGEKSVEEMMQYYYEKSDAIFKQSTDHNTKLQNWS